MSKNDYSSVAKSFRSKPIVKGRTIIDHQLRIRIGIGCNAYVLLDYFSKNPELDAKKVYQATGFEEKHFMPIVKTLEKKGLLSFSSDNTKIKVSTKFRSNDKIKKQFDEFWDLTSISTMDKTKAWPDTKIKAKQMFMKAIEEHGFEYIMERRNLYIRHLELQDFMFKKMMTAARFLNPENKEYEAEFEKFFPVTKTDKEKREQQITKQMLDKQYE